MTTRRKYTVHFYINKLNSLKQMFYTVHNFFEEFETITSLNMKLAIFWVDGYVDFILPDDGG
jgi:hypothetical protein